MADEPAPKKNESGGWLTKVAAAVFGTIIAPIVVAVGVQWAKVYTPDKPDASPAKDAAKDAAPKEVAPKGPAPKAPEFGVIDLITPNLADHFYLYAWNEEEKKETRSDVIDPNLFRYDDKEKPARIFVFGGKRRAIITTRADYEDYTLNLWYRWGKKNEIGPKDPPEGFPRLGSVGVHGTGSDGAVEQVYGQNVAIRIGEGQVGTINLLALAGVMTCKAKVVETRTPDNKLRRVFSPDAPAIPISSREPEEWYPSFILRRGFPALTEYKGGNWTGEGIGQGWHPEGDPTIKKVCPPYGPTEWNKVRIECQGATVKVHVNGKLMNEITDLNVHRGRIGITSQGADWEIGRLEIETRPPANTAQQPAEKRSP